IRPCSSATRAMKRLALIVPISIFLIFVLLFDAFKLVKSAVLILLNVPFALIGGILALLITGIPLSVSAAIGFIALFGQAVLNGVVMVSYFNQLREKGATALHAVRSREVHAIIQAIDRQTRTLTLAYKHGHGPQKVTWNADTNFLRDWKFVSAAELKEGTHAM